jgi:hypothetical protein
MKSLTFIALVASLSQCNSNDSSEDLNQALTEQQGYTSADYSGENIGQFDGYIDGILQVVNHIEYDVVYPTKTIGKEKWTYYRIDAETEAVFIEFKVDEVRCEQRFVLIKDTLVYAREEESKGYGEGKSTGSERDYIIYEDSVVDFSTFSTMDQDKTKSPGWSSKLIFDTWKAHKSNFKKLKTLIGVDGVKDIAAMEILQEYAEHNYPIYERHFDVNTPLKIVIAHSLGKGATREETIICNTEEEKKKFFSYDDRKESRGSSILYEISGNKVIFGPYSSDPGYYIEKLVFKDGSLILQEIRIGESE